MQVEKEQKRWPERDERERRWFDPQTAAELVDEPELSDLIAALPERLADAAAPRAKRAAGG